MARQSDFWFYLTFCGRKLPFDKLLITNCYKQKILSIFEIVSMCESTETSKNMNNISDRFSSHVVAFLLLGKPIILFQLSKELSATISETRSLAS